MQTIAQQLNVTEFPFVIKDSKGNVIYYEYSNGYWWKSEYNSEGNEIYFENFTGYWWKKEYNSEGKEIYYEDSDGYVVDNRPKNELTLEEIASKFGIPLENLRIKD